MTPSPAIPNVPETDPTQPQLPQDTPDIDFNPDTSVSSGFGAASGPSSSTPGMLGDSYITGAHVNYTLNTGESFSATIPYGGRYKCADNTGPVPTDRVSFAYKHFHNALDQISTDATGGMTPQSSTGHIDMYTLGLEKSFMDQLFSVEFRMPFYGGGVFQDPFANNGGSFLESPNVGNLSVILKTLFTRNDRLAIGGGLGIDFPTSENSSGQALNLQSIDYENDAMYLAPFIAFLATPSEDTWVQGVLQFSFVANQGNGLFTPANAGGGGGGGGGDIGLNFREQDLVFLTVNAGRWLYREPSRGWFTGIAAMAELNYSATLDETNVTSATSGNLTVSMANFANHQDIINLTLGLHVQVTELTNMRISAVAPLTGGGDKIGLQRDRYFDSEVSVQVNRNF